MITWDKSLQALSQWMIDSKTLPQLRIFLLQTLRRWRTGQDPPPLPPHDQFGLHHAIAEQSILGWKNFLDGFISIAWVHVQDQYYKWLSIRRTGRRWVTALLIKLWDVSWTMWDDRNDALHTAITPRKVIAIQAANALIRTLYLDGTDHVLRRDHRIFATQLDTILSRSLREKRLWIETVQLAQAALIHQQAWAPAPRLAHLQAQQSLQTWLNTAATNPSVET
jgi:hypothetical protein